ncbi:IclR family transcriptional regulator [Actinomadura luteofluorescens]|uniref:IclR family transcriptional regulator n=1 Tax=Actinomadura luteofluorescens TaxID=46163 RepID=UPI00363C6F3C
MTEATMPEAATPEAMTAPEAGSGAGVMARREVMSTARRESPPSMIERMTLILDAFNGPTARLTLEDVARRTRLPRSTAHRILDQLVRQRWLAHHSFGYGLGQRALGLGGQDGGHGKIREAAAPLLHELQVTTGLVAHLAVLDGADIFYLDKLGGRLATSVPSRVGGRAPAHCTALGKAMLAWLEPEQVDALLGSGISRFTSRTIGELGTLHQELHRIRQRRDPGLRARRVLPRHRLRRRGDPRRGGARRRDLPGRRHPRAAGERRAAGRHRRPRGLADPLPRLGPRVPRGTPRRAHPARRPDRRGDQLVAGDDEPAARGRRARRLDVTGGRR